MNLDQILDEVTTKHPEFTRAEIQELCEGYLQTFPQKTKESTKQKSLIKFLNKEFFLDLEWDEDPSMSVRTKQFSAIPKALFQSAKYKQSDYVLRIEELHKQIGHTILFEQAELNVKAGEKIALVGKNGAGKSTLLKMIIGVEEVNTWSIQKLKDLNIGYLSQDLFWDKQEHIVQDEMLKTLPEVTANTHRLQEIEKLLEEAPENAMELVEEQADLIEWMIHHDGYQKYALQTEILKYFGFCEEHLWLEIKKLSGGEQTKMQIAQFLIQEVDLLILDEPTNHLDIEGILFLEEFCHLWGKTLICISHDKAFLNRVFDHVVEISHKKLFSYHGNYDQYLEQKQQNYDKQCKDCKNQQKYLEQQEKFIERFRYKASKASQVQSRIKQLDKIDKIELPENDTEVKKISFKIQERLPNTVMELEELAVWYEKNILVNLPSKLTLDPKSKIGIIGANGCGKTTLIRTILGELPAVFGGVMIHEKLRIGSYAQVADSMDFEATVLQELLGPGTSQKEIRTILGALLIRDEKIDQKISTLSWWEKAKVALTKMLLQKPHVIIMDEPTNHLDIPSKDAIKHMLAKFDGVSIIVSHDRDFLAGTCNILWAIHNQQLTVFHDFERAWDTV